MSYPYKETSVDRLVWRYVIEIESELSERLSMLNYHIENSYRDATDLPKAIQFAEFLRKQVETWSKLNGCDNTIPLEEQCK